LPGTPLLDSIELLHGKSAGPSGALDLTARTTFVYALANPPEPNP
jgi:hypothetical protein